MQKFGKCEYCGASGLVADYGYKGEFICIDCALADEHIRDHVNAKIVKRYGQKYADEIFKPQTKH